MKCPKCHCITFKDWDVIKCGRKRLTVNKKQIHLFCVFSYYDDDDDKVKVQRPLSKIIKTYY
jgi:hypothetical protein